MASKIVMGKKMRWLLIIIASAVLLCSPVYATTNFTLNGLLMTPTIFDIDKDPSNGLEIAIGGFSPKENPDDSYLFLIYNNGTSLSGWPTAHYVTTGPDQTAGVVFAKPGIADLSGGQRYDVIIPMEELVVSAVTTYLGYFKTFYGNGALWWRHWQANIGKPSYSSPVVADIDSDNDYEILVGRDDGYLYAYNHDGMYWYWEDGWGNYRINKWKTLISAGSTVTTPAVGDIDGDNINEIVACSSGGYCRILKANTSVDEHIYTDTKWNSEMAVMTFGAGGLSSPVIANLTGDADLEIIISSLDGKVYAWESNGSLISGWPATAEPSTYPSPAVGDIDFDGDLEVVVATDNNKIYAFEHDGTKISGFPVRTPEEGTAPRSSPILADVTGDHNLEIIFAIGKHEEAEVNFGKVYIWDKDGNPVANPAITAGDWFVGTPAVADIDDDGNNELVAGSWDGNLYIWEGAGKSTRNIGWPNFHYDERNTRCYLCGNENPSATITSPSDGYSVNEGGGVSFKGLGVDQDGTIAEYLWKSNHTDHTSLLNESQNFSTSNLSVGTHNIELTVSDNEFGNGRDSITVTVTNVLPTASISSPNNLDSFSEGMDISFSGTGSDALGTVSYGWSSSIDGSLDSNQGFNKADLSVGAHTITLTVTDDEGTTTTDSIDITITNVLPTANITAPGDSSSFSEGVPITFSGTGSDALGSITGYSWSSSLDGFLSSSQSFSSSALRVGIHTISLTVTDDESTTGVESITVTIVNTPPSPGINSPTEGSSFFEADSIAFSGTASDALGTITGYRWSSSINGLLSYSKDFSISMLSVGTHVMSFTATDDEGGTSTITRTIPIYNKDPTASISSPQDGNSFSEGTTISFSGSGSDAMGTIAGYTWSSNLDGALSTSQSFGSSGLSVGNHTITLTVRDDERGKGNDSVSITIEDVPPNATISTPSNGSSFLNGTFVNFSGIGTDAKGSVSYEWTSDWEGGILSDQSEFSIHNLRAGYTHKITLTVTDDEGSIGTDTIWVTINKPTTTSTVTGGGGGGGGSKDEKEEVTKALDQILPGETGKVVFSEAESPYISEITIKTEDAAYNVEIKVEPVAALPATIPPVSKGLTFSNMEITSKGVTTSSISDAYISFKVPIKWMRDNNVNQQEVSLFRYHLEEWAELDTSFKAEDSSYDYFTAKTPGFSYFAIVVNNGTGFDVEEPLMDVPTAAHPPITMLPNGTYVLDEDLPEETPVPPEEPIPSISPPVVEDEGNNKIILGLVLMVVLAATAYFLLKSRLE